MTNKISDVPEVTIREGYRSRRPLPRRGQIKSKIASNAVHSIVSALSRASSRHYRSTVKPYSEVEISEGYRSRRPLPKRGQIKLKIAANAVHSIVSALSRASSRPHRSTIKPYSRNIKDMRNH